LGTKEDDVVSRNNYVSAITAMVKALKSNNPIICGLSMAGHVRLAVGVRADEVGAEGRFHFRGKSATSPQYSEIWQLT
jgi:hypothetical protein